MGDLLGCNFDAIDLQHTSPTLGHPGTIVSEVECDDVFSGLKRLRRLPTEPANIKKIVCEYGLPLEQVKAVTVGFAALGYQHSFGPALRNIDIRCDCE